MKRVIGLLCLLPQLLQAQSIPVKDYPQGYFRNPLNVPIILAGNFGELRPNHFHSGMDIKTQQKENLPVHAAADGYVSRIGVSHTGFGNVLYITHPNGYTTVYAHLNAFFPALQQYVKKQQYQAESWASDLTIPAGMFPVRKGDFVAWSGNTGGSAGPHLHFEIRSTTTEKPLNPLLFGFDIADTKAPDVYRLAIYDREKSIYEQKPLVVALKKVGGEYVTTQPVVKINAAQAGIGVSAIDRMNTGNIYGIYEVTLFQNNEPDIDFQLDNIGYEETRYLNAHIDYKTKKDGGPYYQLVFSLPGNKLDIYHDLKGDGTIHLSDGAVHNVKLLVKDAYGNTSTVKLALQQSDVDDAQKACANTMYPDSRNIFENNQVEFYLDETALYDQVCFNYLETASVSTKAYSNVYHLHNALVPVHDFFDVRLRATRAVPENLQSKIVMVREAQGSNSTSATTLENGWYKGTFRDFGNFHLEVDTVAPKVTPLGVKPGAVLSKAAKLSFAMNDASGIKSYRAELDGKWLLFSRRGNVLTYTFDEHCPPGAHMLVLKVTDVAGNEGIYRLSFKR
ncbi:Peptidase family M23 [Chitinophaga ginsengisegetis]|uniref:Peptidase family M23 n=1 Tax=Chitinophaga ginsengisegetis TaxID=393003 RepID=A0A1T5P4U3_9BACT|nr:M23 family metallopeptidase [Chitinophaga ginsengisegetis]SKD07712.1 Peptidase family M23 [Chitinophaga ginsengisegetis]